MTTRRSEQQNLTELELLYMACRGFEHRGRMLLLEMDGVRQQNLASLPGYDTEVLDMAHAGSVRYCGLAHFDR